jgi:hypothetical protein
MFFSSTMAAKCRRRVPACFGTTSHSHSVGRSPPTICSSELSGVISKSALFNVIFILAETGVASVSILFPFPAAIPDSSASGEILFEPMRAVMRAALPVFIFSGVS